MRASPPAEWAPQRLLFTAFPSDATLWRDDLSGARAEVAALVRQLQRSVPVVVLAAGSEAEAAARAALGDAALVRNIPFGDIWLRDTGPLFVDRRRALRFRFNGWGGKYQLAGDETVGAAMAGEAGAVVTLHDFVLEGGAIEWNGDGLLVTTEQCLLNENRNPGWTKGDAERLLRQALGVRRLIWLGEGLQNDHTDGHIDNLARFVGPGTIAIPEALTADDPNAAIFNDAARRLSGQGLVVLRIPSAGRYAPDGEVVPASHMNWIVANGQVVVPLYGGASDAPALAAVRRAFPGHLVTGLAANHILTGGGSFHCITQQVPGE